jgi:hypothetical protein
MKEISFHIAYLLTKHECLVIPGFGALVASSMPASKKELGEMFSPPTRLLSFNPEIKHNDGLLAHSLSAVKKIPYRDADILVKQYVNQLNDLLYRDKTVHIQWAGNFFLSSGNKIIFTPATHLSCNAIHFGLNHFSLLPLKDLNVGTAPVSEIITISVRRRTLAWTASVAAAVLALFLVPVSLNNSPGRPMQKASFFSIFHSPGNPKTGNPVLQDTSLVVSGTAAILPERSLIATPPAFNYYVIIASLPTEKAARITLSDLKKEGFPQAAIVSRQGRHRIYIDRFEKKKEAEIYLDAFRRDHPKHADAWLFSN